MVRRSAADAGVAEWRLFYLRALEAIHADPADDAARLVYADVLLERGAPRGELIVLQCERARTGARPTRRARELLGTYARAWLGPLDKVIMQRDLVYERGFLVACACRTEKKDDLDAAHGHPICSTVTHVDLASAHLDMARLVSHAAFRNLRTIVGIGPRALTRLARPELEKIGIAFFQFAPVLLDKLDAMPNLRAMTSTTPISSSFVCTRTAGCRTSASSPISGAGQRNDSSARTTARGRPWSSDARAPETA